MMFELNPDARRCRSCARLAWKAAPDFENPGDSDRDNVYEVTVVVSDSVNRRYARP